MNVVKFVFFNTEYNAIYLKNGVIFAAKND